MQFLLIFVKCTLELYVIYIIFVDVLLFLMTNSDIKNLVNIIIVSFIQYTPGLLRFNCCYTPCPSYNMAPPKGAKVYPASRRRSNKRVGLKRQLAPHCVP